MLVPESKSKNFNAEDKINSKHVKDNILKVLNDAKKDSKALPNGINLFSELDFQASGDTGKDSNVLYWNGLQSNSSVLSIYKSEYI